MYSAICSEEYIVLNNSVFQYLFFLLYAAQMQTTATNSSRIKNTDMEAAMLVVIIMTFHPEWCRKQT